MDVLAILYKNVILYYECKVYKNNHADCRHMSIISQCYTKLYSKLIPKKINYRHVSPMVKSNIIVSKGSVQFFFIKIPHFLSVLSTFSMKPEILYFCSNK
jgi:hypothetical protein